MSDIGRGTDAIAQFVAACRTEKGRLVQELRPLENGIMHIGARGTDGVWRDITAQRMDQIKAEIASIERTIRFVGSQRPSGAS